MIPGNHSNLMVIILKDAYIVQTPMDAFLKYLKENINNFPLIFLCKTSRNTSCGPDLACISRFEQYKKNI